MKKITLLIALTISLFSYSQVPESMTYQAVVRNGSGNLLTNQNIGIQISIIHSPIPLATTVYVETHNTYTNANGLVTLKIGEGNVILGDFSTIDWSDNYYHIKMEYDLTGGTNYILSSTSRLLSVPYALHAKSGGNLKFIDSSNIISRNAGIGGNGNSVNMSTNIIDGQNIFIGSGVGVSNGNNSSIIQEASSNVILGYQAFNKNTTGYENTGIGAITMRNNTTGNSNVTLGTSTLYANQTGNGNIAIGARSLSSMAAGSNNVALGFSAASSLISGNNNTIIGGNDINFPNSSDSNQLNIGNIIYGIDVDGTNNTISTGKIGIGVKTPLAKLHVNGNVYINDYIRIKHTSGNNWSTEVDGQDDYNFRFNGVLKSYINDTDGSYNIGSDKNLKSNIKVMNTSIVQKVMLLNPVTYSYKNDVSYKKQNGFIAQEVQKIFPELVTKKNFANKEFLTLRYDAFGVLAIKTIQEQQKEINTLKKEITELKKLETRILLLEKNSN